MFTKGFDPAILPDKFQKHGADFKVTTALEYEQMADKFLGGPKSRTARQRVRAKDGHILRFDINTDEFGILAPSGEIMTYYKPDPAIHRQANNLVYFLKKCK